PTLSGSVPVTRAGPPAWLAILLLLVVGAAVAGVFVLRSGAPKAGAAGTSSTTTPSATTSTATTASAAAPASPSAASSPAAPSTIPTPSPAATPSASVAADRA